MRPRRLARMKCALLLLLVAAPGCQGMAARRKVVATEPALAESETFGGSTTVVEREKEPEARLAAAPPMPDSIVDNHPLLSRPREYYDSSGNNKIVKTAAAVIVGVPAGIVGELRQIVRGRPVAPVTPVVPASTRY